MAFRRVLFSRSHKIKPPSQVSLPGDEVRLVRGQKRHSVGDVLRRSQAAHGSLLRQLGQYLGGQGVQHIRADDARRHAVHPDVGGGQLCRQRPGQADEGRLGAGIGDLAAGAPQSPDGGGVDDAPLVVVQHGGQHRLNGVVGAVYVDGEVAVPQLIGDVLKQGLSRHTGVVHQQRYRAEGILHLPDHGIHLFPAGHIRLHRHHPAALPGELFHQ